jgi:hypothetical protein
MRLTATSLTPSASRRPYFEGWNTQEADYRFQCVDCKSSVAVPFKDVVAGAWGWRDRLGDADSAAVTAHFGLKKGSQALRGGWPSISFATCSECQTRYVFYADIDEVSNSVYQVVAQGASKCEA